MKLSSILLWDGWRKLVASLRARRSAWLLLTGPLLAAVVISCATIGSGVCKPGRAALLRLLSLPSRRFGGSDLQALAVRIVKPSLEE